MGIVYRSVFEHLKFYTFQRLHKSYLKLYARQVYFHNIMQNFILTEGINQNDFSKKNFIFGVRWSVSCLMDTCDTGILGYIYLYNLSSRWSVSCLKDT